MEWAVRFRRKGEGDDSLVILQGIEKMLWWIECNAAQCEGVLIVGIRKEEQNVQSEEPV